MHAFRLSSSKTSAALNSNIYILLQLVINIVMSAGGSRKARAPSKRILLSLRLKSLLGSGSSSSSSSGAAGLGPEALVAGQVLPAVVKSVEDHGYSLTFGIKVRGTA